MVRTSIAVMLIATLPGPAGAGARDVEAVTSLRIEGREVALPAPVGARLAGLAREALRACGPNTLQHPHNFGASALLAPLRRERTLQGSRLHVVYARPFETVSHLGGRLPVSEVTLGLGGDELLVGPDFTAHGSQVAEHLHCEYLPSLEIACLPELAPHLPARYGEACARLARDADGKIVMPPPDIAPSCS